jgi:hypothetical protein
MRRLQKVTIAWLWSESYPRACFWVAQRFTAAVSRYFDSGFSPLRCVLRTIQQSVHVLEAALSLRKFFPKNNVKKQELSISISYNGISVPHFA